MITVVYDYVKQKILTIDPVGSEHQPLLLMHQGHDRREKLMHE